LILERFDIFNAKLNGDAAPPDAVEQPQKDIITNGSHTPPKPVADASPKRTAEPSDMSDAADGLPKKKRKPSLDADAIYAAKLQAEEDKLARPTRGGNSRKAAPVKKKSPTKKKKTSARVKVSDDSDVEDSQTGEEKPQRTTGFHVSSAI
jgi:upstream activation factor subunit UAF30